jgi:hypothetical protein
MHVFSNCVISGMFRYCIQKRKKSGVYNFLTPLFAMSEPGVAKNISFRVMLSGKGESLLWCVITVIKSRTMRYAWQAVRMAQMMNIWQTTRGTYAETSGHLSKSALQKQRQGVNWIQVAQNKAQ